ncbi:MAG: hypothetical protein IPN01_26930 [Deltaproteobacteria bacterium]|nr:hypothetical protein [Deltaproteobacteria bacterium]
MPTHPKTDPSTFDPHEPIARLHLRAALFAAPDTLVTAKEFARAMGVRRLSASSAPRQPAPSAAASAPPFRDWLEAIGAASTPKRHRGAP